MSLRVWNGSTYLQSTGVRIWTGSAWTSATAGKVWTGSAWTDFLSGYASSTMTVGVSGFGPIGYYWYDGSGSLNPSTVTWKNNTAQYIFTLYWFNNNLQLGISGGNWATISMFSDMTIAGIYNFTEASASKSYNSTYNTTFYNWSTAINPFGTTAGATKLIEWTWTFGSTVTFTPAGGTSGSPTVYYNSSDTNPISYTINASIPVTWFYTKTGSGTTSVANGASSSSITMSQGLGTNDRTGIWNVYASDGVDNKYWNVTLETFGTGFN